MFKKVFIFTALTAASLTMPGTGEYRRVANTTSITLRGVERGQIIVEMHDDTDAEILFLDAPGAAITQEEDGDLVIAFPKNAQKLLKKRKIKPCLVVGQHMQVFLSGSSGEKEHIILQPQRARRMVAYPQIANPDETPRPRSFQRSCDAGAPLAQAPGAQAGCSIS